MNKSSLATVPLEDIVPADIFKADVRRWAERIGVQPKEIHIRPMMSRVTKSGRAVIFGFLPEGAR